MRGSGPRLRDMEEEMLGTWGVNGIKTPSRYEGDELKGESSGIRMTQVREDRSR